ncbi:MAG: hypothetical protein D6775_01350, partial [Caldilineae bacterium]
MVPLKRRFYFGFRWGCIVVILFLVAFLLAITPALGWERSDVSASGREMSAPPRAPEHQDQALVPLAPNNVVHWKDPVSGNWSDPTKWDTGSVPTSSDNVFITVAGSYAVTLDVNAEVNSLTLGGSSGAQTLSIGGPTLTLNGASTVNVNGVVNLSGGTLTGSGDLTVNGTFNWSGGTISGSGVLTVTGPLNISGNADKHLSGTLNNQGTATWTGAGRILFNSKNVFNNQAGATFDIQTDSSASYFYGSPGSFNNAGTVTKSAGSGTTLFYAVDFNNSGAVNVNSGTLKLAGGGSDTGDFTIAAGSVLQFAGGTHSLDGVAFGGAGTVEITSGTVNTTGGGATVSGSATLDLSGGTLGGDGPMTVNGTFNWSGGTVSGSGAFTVNSPLNISGSNAKYLSGRTLSNGGTATWTGTGYIYLNSGAVFDNQAGATFDIQTDSWVDWSVGDIGHFNNAGTVTKSAGSGVAGFDVAFNNSSAVNVNSGTLKLRKGGSDTGDFT